MQKKIQLNIYKPLAQNYGTWQRVFPFPDFKIAATPIFLLFSKVQVF